MRLRSLASHTASGGKRTFKIPSKVKTVRELFSGRLVAEDCDKLEDVLNAPDTVLYQID